LSDDESKKELFAANLKEEVLASLNHARKDLAELQSIDSAESNRIQHNSFTKQLSNDKKLPTSTAIPISTSTSANDKFAGLEDLIVNRVLAVLRGAPGSVSQVVVDSRHSKELHSSDDALVEVGKERRRALSAREAERAAALKELQDRRDQRCKSCLTRWSSESRVCVERECRVVEWSRLPTLKMLDETQHADLKQELRRLDFRQLRLNDARAALFARYVGPDKSAGRSKTVLVQSFVPEWVPPSESAVPSWLQASGDKAALGADKTAEHALAAEDLRCARPCLYGAFLPFASCAALTHEGITDCI